LRLERNILTDNRKFRQILAELWFHALDTDEDGTISFEELVVGLSHVYEVRRDFDTTHNWLMDLGDNLAHDCGECPSP